MLCALYPVRDQNSRMLVSPMAMNHSAALLA